MKIKEVQRVGLFFIILIVWIVCVMLNVRGILPNFTFLLYYLSAATCFFLVIPDLLYFFKGPLGKDDTEKFRNFIYNTYRLVLCVTCLFVVMESMGNLYLKKDKGFLEEVNNCTKLGHINLDDSIIFIRVVSFRDSRLYKYDIRFHLKENSEFKTVKIIKCGNDITCTLR